MGSMKDLFGDEPYQLRPTRPKELPPKMAAASPIGIPDDVCALFEEMTLALRKNGFKHYSADAILHRIRWHMQVERGLRDFKCNNNWTAPLARWLLAKHPDHLKEFFEIRKSPKRSDQ